MLSKTQQVQSHLAPAVDSTTQKQWKPPYITRRIWLCNMFAEVQELSLKLVQLTSVNHFLIAAV